MSAIGLREAAGSPLSADGPTISAGSASMSQPTADMPLALCPRWCERPSNHGWEDDAAAAELMRVHRRTFPISGTDHGSLMVLVTEVHGPAGIERGPARYVVDTGLKGDCELDEDGARGLAAVFAAALTLTADPP